MPLLDQKYASSVAVPAYFLRPDERAREENGLLVDYEYGGAAIQDPSQGLLVKVWKLWVEGEDVRIAPWAAENAFRGAALDLAHAGIQVLKACRD